MKNKDKIQKIERKRRFMIYLSKQTDKTCFQHAYESFKDLTTWTVSDKIWDNKAFNIAKNPKCDG